MFRCTRRQLLQGVSSVSAGPLILRGRTKPKNLLFIMSDQHLKTASGCYGNTEVKTPNIDEIARGGIRFKSAYCQAPVCVPSRGSIVTGLYPHRHGARVLKDPLPANSRTVGHYFQKHGYVTGAIGKMHFVDESNRHGFQHRLNEADFLATLNEDEQRLLRQDQGGAGGTDGRPSKLPARFFQDNYFADQTVQFLRENKNRPFCLWSSFYMPHTPLVPMAEYFDLYRSSPLSLPLRSHSALQGAFPGHLIRARERGWYQQTDTALLESLRGYYGNISQMDACVGRVFNALRELGLDRNTVVVYTSDHGEMADAHRMWTKHNMFEESVAVPLVVSAPGEVEAGASRNEIIEQIDLFPTLAEFCGIGSPRGIHGKSFSSLLRGRRYTPREFAYSEYYFCHDVFTRDNRYVGKEPILMIRTDRWKLNHLSWDRSEFYDMQQDPREFTNLIDSSGSGGVVKELERSARRMYAL